jgi:hypothetical protein
MRGLAVFVVFFSIFLISSLLIPSPLFPGSVVALLFGVIEEFWLVCALMNGLVYGLVVWAVYCVVFRWVDHVSSKELDREKKT